MTANFHWSKVKLLQSNWQIQLAQPVQESMMVHSSKNLKF